MWKLADLKGHNFCLSFLSSKHAYTAPSASADREDSAVAAATSAPPPPPLQQQTEKEKEGEKKENAYVSVLGKKCRALKKKLERIKELEEKQAAGKARSGFILLLVLVGVCLLAGWGLVVGVHTYLLFSCRRALSHLLFLLQQALDEAQVTLLHSKDGVDRLLKEVEALKAQVRAYLVYVYRR